LCPPSARTGRHPPAPVRIRYGLGTLNVALIIALPLSA
jgi:hypothetical protein